MQIKIRSICQKIILFLLLVAPLNTGCFSLGMVAEASRWLVNGGRYFLAVPEAILGKKMIAACAAGAVGLYAAKALYQRYFTLPDYKDKLTPPAGEDVNRRCKKFYTWHPDGLDISTVENLRQASTHDLNNQLTTNLSESRLIKVLRDDCNAFDIYNHNDVQAVLNGTRSKHTLHPIVSGEIHWEDLIATLNFEMRDLSEMKEYLRRSSCWHIIGERYRLGAERDLEKVLATQGLYTKEDERQMTSVAENAVHVFMTQPVTLQGRVTSILLGAPNYDKIYSLYWVAYRRLAWLEVFKGIIERVATAQGFDHLIPTIARPRLTYAVDPHQPAGIFMTGNPVGPQQGGPAQQQPVVLPAPNN